MKSNPEKEEKVLQWIKEHAPEETKRKNHLDDDLFMQLTPMMQQMFASGISKCRMSDFDSGENMVFTRVDHSEIPFEKITADEYAALPERYKHEKNMALKALGDCIVQFILMLVAIVLLVISFVSGDDKTQLAMMGFVLVTAAIFAITYIMVLTARKDFIIPPDAMVRKGNVIMLTSEPETSPDIHSSKYYAAVAFYDEKRYALKIECSETAYRKLELDSEVLVYNDLAYAL